MNKTLHYCLAAVALLVLTGCAAFHISTNAAAFRINMKVGYGPHKPSIPAPTDGATQWNDVGNWQSFLVSKGFLAAGKFTMNTFDAATEAATKKFQASNGTKETYALPATGCVNYATYRKAVQQGLPRYKAIRTSKCATSARHALYAVRATGKALATGDNFRDNFMASGCNDSGGWYDVQDWQTFLVENGYLMTGQYTPGNFDGNNTTKATQLFQKAWSIPSDPSGDVGEKTYAFATSTTFANDGGALLVSNDGVTPTVEDRIGCK